MADYKIKLDRKVLKLLGTQLYGDVPSIIAELVANSYDADAMDVWITMKIKENSVIIEDNGKGMTAEEINDLFLNIGYNKRTNESVTSLGRQVMGRKGIGKLAAFSLTNTVKVISCKNGKKAGCLLNFEKITLLEEEPEEILEEDIEFELDRLSETFSGTRIELINIKKRLASSYRFIVSRLIRMFDVNDKSFQLYIRKNSEEYKLLHRRELNYFEIMDTIVTIGNENISKKETVLNNSIGSEIKRAFTYEEFLSLKPRAKLKKFPYKLDVEDKDGNIVPIDFQIHGWIGTVDSLHNLNKINDKLIGTNNEDNEKITISDNRISLFSRGKLGEFDILPKIKVNTNYEAYIIGEFFVDVFEDDNLMDMATSNRRAYEEIDSRYVEVIKIVKKLLAFIVEQKNIVSKKAKGIEDRKEIEKIKSDFLTKFDSKNILDTKLSEEERSIIHRDYTQFTRAVNMGNSTKKIFISHKGQHKLYGQFIVDVLEKYGIDVESTIIFTSDDRLGVPLGRNIYDYLKECFREDLFVIFIFSKAFYDSNICISEVGAAWATNNDYINIVVDIDFVDIDYPCDRAKSGFEFKNIRTNSQQIVIKQFFKLVLKKIGIDSIDAEKLDICISEVLESDNYSDEAINNSAEFLPERKFMPKVMCPKCNNKMKMELVNGKACFKCYNDECKNTLPVNFGE